MRTIFESCEPRQEVLQGELKDEIFRASLIDVHRDNAEDVYKDPAIFFDHTYRTEGLKTLLQEALGRLTGSETCK
jgi:predicted AAA+ superfamily ATPase